MQFVAKNIPTTVQIVFRVRKTSHNQSSLPHFRLGSLSATNRCIYSTVDGRKMLERSARSLEMLSTEEGKRSFLKRQRTGKPGCKHVPAVQKRNGRSRFPVLPTPGTPRRTANKGSSHPRGGDLSPASSRREQCGIFAAGSRAFIYRSWGRSSRRFLFLADAVQLRATTTSTIPRAGWLEYRALFSFAPPASVGGASPGRRAFVSPLRSFPTIRRHRGTQQVSAPRYVPSAPPHDTLRDIHASPSTTLPNASH